MSSFYIKVQTTDLSLVGKPVNISLSIKPVDISLSAAFSVITIPSLNQAFVESLVLTESTALVFGKPLSNAIALTDGKALTLARTLSNALTVAEGSTLSSGLFKGDSAGFADNELFGTTKALSNTTSVIDLNILSMGKPLSDSGSWADLPSVGAGKIFTNAFTAGDGDILLFGKRPSDSASFSDAVNLFELGLFLNEVAYVTDDADGVAGDDSSYTFVKITSNMSLVADNDTIGFTGVKSDAFGIADAGSGRSQGYCSLDYFLEDYVGSIWTF